MNLHNLTLADLCEEIPHHEKPKLDRPDAAPQTEYQAEWVRDGAIILRNFIPHDLIEAYCRVREPLGPGGWPAGTPYMKVDEIKDISLYSPLVAVIESVVGEPVAMNLNLTGWVSTERQWHQDDYLNPSYVKAAYAATWIALDDIDPDCGVFQYAAGSHKLPLMRQEKLFEYLDESERRNPDWPWLTEGIVAGLFEEEIQKRGFEVKSFDAKKGDVLIWHGALVHRGSRPKRKGLVRKSLITHYSAISRRYDMPTVGTHVNGRKYFVL